MNGQMAVGFDQAQAIREGWSLWTPHLNPDDFHNRMLIGLYGTAPAIITKGTNKNLRSNAEALDWALDQAQRSSAYHVQALKALSDALLARISPSEVLGEAKSVKPVGFQVPNAYSVGCACPHIAYFGAKYVPRLSSEAREGFNSLFANALNEARDKNINWAP